MISTGAVRASGNLLGPAHPSRFLARLLYVGVVAVYLISYEATPVAPPWILAAAGTYLAVLFAFWLAAHRFPDSDVPFASVLVLDLAALSLIVVHDPLWACPTLLGMLLVVLDNGFRREARYYFSGFLCAMLVGLVAVVLRDWQFGHDAARASVWMLVFVMFACGYGYFLFGAMRRLRQRLASLYQLADASEDLVFALDVRSYAIAYGNSATRERLPAVAYLQDLFALAPAQVRKFVDEAVDKGEATREWALRDGDRFYEVKAKALADDAGQINRLACTGRDMSLYHERIGRLLDQSRSDPLTGLANRRSLDRRLEAEWRRMQRLTESLAVLMIDIDWFKSYNDRLGHAAGDECLRSVAGILRQTAQRGGDFVARYGGEEFTLLLPNCDADGAAVVAQRIVNAVAAAKLAHPDSPQRRVTVSVGAAALHPDANHRPPALVAAADAALYKAKRHGRNRVVVASTVEASPA